MRQEPEYLEMRLPAKYYFGAWLLLFAATCLPFLLWRCDAGWVPAEIQTIAFLAIVASFALVVWAHSWRIRIDEEGIHKRTQFLTDHLPWELFEQGCVRRGAGYYDFEVLADSMTVPLSFAKANKTLATQALHMCYAHWVVPPRRPLPRKTKFMAKYGRHYAWWRPKPRTPKVVITHEAIKINRKIYRWVDVEKVVIFRASREHENFTALTFKLGNESYHYEKNTHPVTRQDIENATRAANFFEACVPPDRIVVCTEDGPETMAEADERIATIQREIRDISILTIVLSVLVGAFNLTTVRLDSISYSEVVLLSFQVVGLVSPLAKRMALNNQLKELIAQRDQLSIGVRAAC